MGVIDTMFRDFGPMVNLNFYVVFIIGFVIVLAIIAVKGNFK